MGLNILLALLLTLPTAGGSEPASGTVRGWATYCAPTPTHCQSWGDTYVGAVRSFTYGDDPYWLQVCRADQPSTCTHVLIVSYCACGDRRGEPTVVDLSPPAFRELAPLSAGIVRVIVDRGAAPRPTPPPTDTEHP